LELAERLCNQAVGLVFPALTRTSLTLSGLLADMADAANSLPLQPLHLIRQLFLYLGRKLLLRPAAQADMAALAVALLMLVLVVAAAKIPVV
jgi:hypothetical protein